MAKHHWTSPYWGTDSEAAPQKSGASVKRNTQYDNIQPTPPLAKDGGASVKRNTQYGNIQPTPPRTKVVDNETKVFRVFLIIVAVVITGGVLGSEMASCVPHETERQREMRSQEEFLREMHRLDNEMYKRKMRGEYPFND